MRNETKEKVLKLALNENLNILNINDELLTTTLNCKCMSCNKEFSVSSKNFLDPRRTGKVCQVCNAKEKFLNKLNELYGSNPYTFMTEFTGYNNPLKVKCNDCGYEFEVKKASSLLMISNLPEGTHPCKNCTKLRAKAGRSITELESALIEKFGECRYTFPEPEKYKGLFSKEKFKIVCKDCGHEMYTYISNILNPSNGIHYCRVCNNKDRLLENMSYKERCLYVTNNQIEPIEEYVDSKTPIKHKCNICGYGTETDWFKIPVKNTTKNAGCPICSGTAVTSKAEDDIEVYIKSLDPTITVERNRRDLLPSKREIDLYVPEKKVGIEYNGKYWHSEGFKGKKYHSEKRIEAENEGIRLVQIFDDEWQFKKDIVKAKIKSILGYNMQNVIYARSCKLVDIIPADKNKFFDTYHIQGSDKAAFSKALAYNGEIVAVMTLCKSRGSLGSDGSKYELSRYATKYHVVGGFSKLFKHLTTENNITSVLTYADLRWSAPGKNVYEKNGFVLDHISQPNYWYFDTTPSIAPRCHRYGFRKQKLKAEFPDIYDDKLTEFQIMDQTTYRRIWDCGNLVFYWDKK